MGIVGKSSFVLSGLYPNPYLKGPFDCYKLWNLFVNLFVMDSRDIFGLKSADQSHWIRLFWLTNGKIGSHSITHPTPHIHMKSTNQRMALHDYSAWFPDPPEIPPIMDKRPTRSPLTHLNFRFQSPELEEGYLV